MALMRREARELAFTILYEMTFYPEKDPCSVLAQEGELRPFEGNDYLTQVVVGVTEKAPELDALIEECSNGWKVRRISRISLAILRMGAYEMLYVGDVPFRAAINEAVELCKKYNDEKAPAFVNGVLNAIAEKKGLKE